MKKERKRSRYYQDNDFDEYPRKNRKTFRIKGHKINFKNLIHSGDEVDYEYLEGLEELTHEDTNK